MYLRFVVDEMDPDSERRLGVFQIAWRLRDGGTLRPEEEQYLWAMRDWFDDFLERPDRFTAAKPPYDRRQQRAISWFKDSAHEHINRVWGMSRIVERYGFKVTMLKAERVGYVVYEDEFQVVAEPFADTPC